MCRPSAWKDGRCSQHRHSGPSVRPHLKSNFPDLARDARSRPLKETSLWPVYIPVCLVWALRDLGRYSLKAAVRNSVLNKVSDIRGFPGSTGLLCT